MSDFGAFLIGAGLIILGYGINDGLCSIANVMRDRLVQEQRRAAPTRTGGPT